MLGRFACWVATGLAAAGCTALPVAEVHTTRDGVFTGVQAERGKAVYDAYCASCHPAEFYEAQLARWQNAPVQELFESLSVTMPAENPGALATSQYLDVLAYILSITGSPPGNAELTLDNAASVQIVNE